jgi:hypothetical protein
MTRPTFCRRIVRPFVNPDAADDPWCWGVQDAWQHGCLPPHRGLRAVVCVPACSRMRWTSSVTSTGAALVSKPVHNARARSHVVRCGSRAPAHQRRCPVFAAAASCSSPRYERRSPYDLPQPAPTGHTEALASGPPAASPYPILRGVSRRFCAVLRLAARCGGRGVLMKWTRPYADQLESASMVSEIVPPFSTHRRRVP